jgi:segregation and condensation protein B
MQGATMDEAKLCGILEAILFVSGDPISVADVAHALNLTESELSGAIDRLQDHCDLEKRGIRLNRFGGMVQLSIQPEYAPYVDMFLQPVRKQTLSQVALETLSIVAYRQPATKADIESVRGVKCDYSVQALLSKGLIREAGRKETLGRPILYETTDEFLRHFGLTSLEELPMAALGQTKMDLETDGRRDGDQAALSRLGKPADGQSDGRRDGDQAALSRLGKPADGQSDGRRDDDQAAPSWIGKRENEESDGRRDDDQAALSPLGKPADGQSDGQQGDDQGDRQD